MVYEPIDTVLSLGMKGEQVKTLQYLLNEAGYNLEIDGHCLFQLGFGPSAGAHAFRAAEHYQAGAHLLRVSHQDGDLGVGELLARNVCTLGASSPCS